MLHGGAPERIVNTTCDMSLAFEVGIKREFMNSSLIVDKFPVIKGFNDALNKAFRGDVRAGEDLRNLRYLWLKNKCDLSKKQLERFECISKRNCKTTRAYGMRLAMQEIYGLSDKEEARGELRWLVGWLLRSRSVYMKKLAGMVVNHFEGYFELF